jgi:uncharacterized protein YbbC (DUF1343 family)/CubicO group peptidase (beta-lactamase class C family)
MLRVFALLFVSCGLAFAQDLDPKKLELLGPVVDAAIKHGDCPGAVLVVVHKDRVVYRQAFGEREPKVPMTVDTVFDLASLTKSIATATAIHQLAEAGMLRFSDTVSKHWPEFAANGKESVTIEQCLLHTTGLTADNALADYKDGKTKAFENIAKLKLEAPAGTRFRYSDVGYLVLGELVERLSKMPLDEYTAKQIFTPLMLKDTGYKPSEDLAKRCAPTGQRDGKTIRGVVHDPRAHAIAGVAGHAGLFGTADDLATFCIALMNGDKRLLSPFSVKKLTEGVCVPGGMRSLGWDVDTGFTAQRGELFPAGEGFGHTGFTGTSVWVDPPSRTAIILLTNRTLLGEKSSVTDLRRKVGTIVASANPDIGQRAKRLPTPRPPVLTGLDVLVQEKFATLKGKKVGLVTNHTGRDVTGASVIDLLHKADGVKLVTLFSPEHGIRGELDEKVGDGKDEKTGLPVYSLYGERRKPTPEQLQGLDVIVYDIQDIGCRFYTYISTLGLVMEAASAAKIPVLVLDRPNPIGGVLIEGPVRDANRESFVAYHDIPIRHGLTVGEMAKLFNLERKLNVELTVVPCKNWKRGDHFDVTNLPWRNPSPNMRHLNAALLYPGIGLLETTNVSVGRGTERPFEWIGAPWLDGRVMAKELNDLGLPGVTFSPETRTPTGSTHKGKECGGVNIIIDDRSKLRSVTVGMNIATVLKKQYPTAWETKRYDTLLVHKLTFDGVAAGQSAKELEASWTKDLDAFRIRRTKVLIYSE